MASKSLQVLLRKLPCKHGLLLRTLQVLLRELLRKHGLLLRTARLQIHLLRFVFLEETTEQPFTFARLRTVLRAKSLRRLNLLRETVLGETLMRAHHVLLWVQRRLWVHLRYWRLSPLYLLLLTSMRR